MKKWIVPVICLVGMFALGCQSLINRITPSETPKRLVKYAQADPNAVWPTLHTAMSLRTDAIIKHRDTQLNIRRLAEDDKNVSIGEAKALQDKWVGSEAQPGILWSMVLGGLGLWTGGRFIRSPHEKELEKKVNGNS